MHRRWHQAAVVFTLLPCFAVAKSGINRVTGIRAWSHADSTRVIIETTGPVDYKVDRAVNPDRLFFDLLRAQPWIEHKRYAARQINDKLVRRVRVAETTPGTTRIVFDLTGPGSFSVVKLEAPDRLVIEIHPPGPLNQPKPVSSAGSGRSLLAATPPLLDPLPLYPPYLPPVTLPAAPRLLASARPPAAFREPLTGRQPPASYGAAAKASENASQSLTRALGLKVNRIIIDAGHGGHDQGTSGAMGLLEKDVVLDVALRVAKLLQARMGAEVVLTRSDDTFIPLEERSAIANARRGDLFLSIHANSSPAPAVAGTETFFLNFTNSPGALDVAARENSGAGKSVGELRDLIQSITLNDKIAESQTFAQTLQRSLSAQAARSNVTAKNRGVKRAPFVVLIGASMPSVLAEIGFLTNARDEANLAKPDYRQKIAEALYKGVSQYSLSLSHFEDKVAGNSGAFVWNAPR